MAMLAEKKRKTKWCLNPMGNDWAKDENKFGQKLLEKMGWTPGTGLGARGQGSTKIIKMNVKNDTLGLGVDKESEQEVWTKQLVNFDSLLAQLNGDADSKKREPDSLPSLEEKSKASRARVHYHKFTRGKDLSKYSSKDLKSILPLHKEKSDAQDPSAQAMNNMYAYFNKNGKNPYKHQSNYGIEDPLEDDTAERCAEDIKISDDDNQQFKKTKKKKKEAICIEDFPPNFAQNNDDSNHNEKSKNKKNSKSKLKNHEVESKESLDELVENTEIILANCDENPTRECKSKKKKKSRSKSEIINDNFKETSAEMNETQTPTGDTETNEVDTIEVVPKKKRKKSDKSGVVV